MLQIKTFPRLSIPQDTNYVKSDRGGKRLLVILLALLWGMEIGFKFASRTVIYLLNPCHVTTLIQVSIFKLLLLEPNNFLIIFVFITITIAVETNLSCKKMFKLNLI